MVVAGVTVVAGLFVVVAPSAIQCAQSEEGIAACLRDRVADIGLLPPREPAEVTTAVAEVPAETPAAETPATPEPESAAETPTTAEGATPDITLIRAETDGSVIIAGTAAPRSEVTVYANGEPFGTVTAEPSGDWALVPDGPLPAGDTAITVGAAGVAAVAPRSFVVKVTPGSPAEVLEGTAAQPAAVAATEPEVAVAEAEPPATEPAATEPAATEPPTQVADVPETTTSEPAAAAPAVDVATAEPEPEPAAEPETPAVDVAATEPETQPAAETPEARPEDLAVAAVEPEAITPTAPDTTPTPMVQPTIDGIEIDGERNFFAGKGEDGATVQVFVDGTLAGETKVADGFWLVEAHDVLTQPRQLVRADVTREGSTTVTASAEVNFEVDLPATRPQPAVDVASAEPGANAAGLLAPADRARREVALAVDTAAEAAALAAAEREALAAEQAADKALATETRAREDVALALETPRTVVAPEPAPAEEPAVDVAAEPAVPAAADRAQDEVQVALASPHEVAAPAVEPVTAPAVVADVPAADEPAAVDVPAAAETAVAIADRARADVAQALDNPVTAPEPAVADVAAAEPAPAVEAAEPAMDRAREDVTLALDQPVEIAEPSAAPAEVAPVPEAVEPTAAPREEPVEASEPAATEPEPGAAPADRARGEVETALAQPAEITPPVPQSRPATASAATRPAVEPEVAEPEAAAVEPQPVEPAGGEAAHSADVDATTPAVEPEPAATEVAAAEPEIPTIRAEPVGDPDAWRFSSGKVIIRRGDTLWDISERVYGGGWKYRVIYRANRDKIRLPRLIFPGQVFELPELQEQE